MGAFRDEPVSAVTNFGSLVAHRQHVMLDDDVNGIGQANRPEDVSEGRFRF
jgi:hypothetical protein